MTKKSEAVVTFLVSFKHISKGRGPAGLGGKGVTLLEDIEKIYQQEGQTVYRFLLTKTRDEHLAEELTQETFYQAVKSVDRFRGDCKVSVWLCQIAKHLWYQNLEKQKREAPTKDFPELPYPSAEEAVLAQEGRMDLLRLVHELPEPQREVVYLRAFGSLSFREIGDIMGKTETWARVTFYRSKEKLKNGGVSDEE